MAALRPDAVPPRAPQPKPVREGAECAMCKFVLETIKQTVDSPETAEEIEEKALAACNLLPASFKDACTGFVEVYEPMLFRAINATDVEELCQDAALCPAAYLRVPPPPLPAPLVAAFAPVLAPLQEQRRQPQQLQQQGGNSLFDACDTCKVRRRCCRRCCGRCCRP
jgi:hypothetical protein